MERWVGPLNPGVVAEGRPELWAGRSGTHGERERGTDGSRSLSWAGPAHGSVRSLGIN